MWLLYELLLILGLSLYLPKALWRRRLPHPGWSMRLGRYPAEIRRRLSQRSSIWIHAVSVGEVMAAQPLVSALQAVTPRRSLVLSAVTPSGFEVASTRLGDAGTVIYVPLDFRVCVRRALEVIHPTLLLLMEFEVWPTAIRLATERGIPVVIVNGRVSSGAFRRYRVVAPWFAGTLRRVTRFLMQSQTDADRVIALGAPTDRVQVVGNLKWEAGLRARPSESDVRDTAKALGLNSHEPVIVAGSTHRGEEAALLRAFQSLRGAGRRLRLIIAPRHLERLAEIEAVGRHCGLRVARLSEDRVGASGWEVGLVDAFGQLPRFYGVATVAFIGGSLIPHGGQNPLEAASLGKPILFGPSMQNFADIAQQLLTHQAARQLPDARQLAPALEGLLEDRAVAQAMGRRAQALLERSQGAMDRTLHVLRPLLSVPVTRH